MPVNPRRQPFFFGRSLMTAPDSLAPDTIRTFVSGASRLLLSHVAEVASTAENVLIPASSLDVSILPARMVRIAYSHAPQALQSMPQTELKAGLYDLLPDTKASDLRVSIGGVAIVGRGLLSLELESSEITVEIAEATAALKAVLQIGADVELGTPHAPDLAIGRFVAEVSEEAADALYEVTGSFARGHALTFAPIPDPRQSTE
jgi:prepilin signal peptidase PulO-like enzyme (type II secretory pathway)